MGEQDSVPSIEEISDVEHIKSTEQSNAAPDTQEENPKPDDSLT